MILGAVVLASVAGLTGFVASLGMGTSFLTSLAIYSAVGTATLAASIAWGLVAPWIADQSVKPDVEWSLASNGDS